MLVGMQDVKCRVFEHVTAGTSYVWFGRILDAEFGIQYDVPWVFSAFEKYGDRIVGILIHPLTAPRGMTRSSQHVKIELGLWIPKRPIGFPLLSITYMTAMFARQQLHASLLTTRSKIPA